MEKKFLSFQLRGTFLFLCPAVVVCLLSSGCSTPPLRSARADFHAGRFNAAEEKLEVIPENNKDEALYLLERGMIRQELGDYEASAGDWRKAADIIRELDVLSISEGASSLVVNDRVMSFRGKPFERTLLYAFLAKNYMAVGNWDFAGIAGRNIIEQLENLNDYPDIAYGRYMAGVCMEIMNDPGNAAIQYRKVHEIAPWIVVDPKTGFIFSAPPAPELEEDDDEPMLTQTPPEFVPETPPPPEGMPFELVCFIGTTRFAGYGGIMFRPYVEIYHDDILLGRSYLLSDTEELMEKTRQRELVAELAKTAARIATKEVISRSVESQSEVLGALTRLLLFASEAPDDRRWETLPHALSVARVYSPEDVSSLKAVFKSSSGSVLFTRTISSPIVRRGRTWYTFFRDIAPAHE